MRLFHIYQLLTQIYQPTYNIRFLQNIYYSTSMNTTSDKKRTNGTIDRTSPYTGAGIEYNTTFQRKNSDSRSTSSNVSMSNNFEIAAQTLMPILLKIKDQNQRFGSQKNQICEQLKTLEKLTQNLVTQNQALRLHYKQRSNDVKQLIQSLTVNFNEDLNQTKHLVHMYREHNCMLAKQIQQINSKMSYHQQIINKVAPELLRTTASNTKVEDNLRSRQVKNKLTSKTMNKLEKTRDAKKIDQLEKQICDLQLDINLMRKKNMFTLNYIRGQKIAISAQKPQIKDRAIQAIKSGKKLKQQVEIIEADYKKYRHQKEVLQRQTEKLNQKYQNMYASAESKRNKLKKLTQKKSKMQEDNIKLKCSNQFLINEKSKKQDQRSKLEKQIKKKKQSIQDATFDNQKKKNNITNQTLKKIVNSKQQIRKIEGNMNKTIYKQLNPQKMEYENTIVNLRKQLQTLNGQQKELRQKIDSMQNPMKDIIRMQMQLKKMKPSRR